MTDKDWLDLTRIVYELTRLEAELRSRPVVAEEWEHRDEAFRRNMLNVVKNYCLLEKLPTPKEAHDSWVRAYKEMGWTWGPERDPVKKTHPDLVPFEELHPAERIKDEIFLTFIEMARKLKEIWEREDL